MIIFEQQVLLFWITMLHGTLYVLCSLDALLLNMLLLRHVDIICSGQLIYACRCLCNYYQQLHPSCLGTLRDMPLPWKANNAV